MVGVWCLGGGRREADKKTFGAKAAWWRVDCGLEVYCLG